MTTNDTRRSALTHAYERLLGTHRNLLEVVAEDDRDDVAAFLDAVLVCVAEYQSPMWGPDYINPAQMIPDRLVDHTIHPEARADHAINKRHQRNS